MSGSNSSMGFPDGSSRMICLSPMPVMIHCGNAHQLSAALQHRIQVSNQDGKTIPAARLLLAPIRHGLSSPTLRDGHAKHQAQEALLYSRIVIQSLIVNSIRK